MQALLLATGETQKLRPLTERIPSPMVNIINRPIMLYNLILLGQMGFKQILVNVHSLADRIESYFGDGQRWGLSLEYILQRDALGSAGALRWTKHLLKDHFIVMPADQVVDMDISQAIEQHVTRNAAATVIVQPGLRKTSMALQIEEGRYIRAVGTGSSAARLWTDVGIYIFSPRVLDWVPARQAFDIHHHLLPALLQEGVDLQVCPLPGYYNPLDTFQDYMEAQHMFLAMAFQEENLLERKVSYCYNFLESRQLSEGLWIGKNVRIHPSVKIVPKVSIGSNSWIGQGAELGPNAVIGSNVVVDQGATVKDSIILNDSYIGKLVHLENRLVHQEQLIDLSTEDHVQVSDPVMLGKTDPHSIMTAFKRPLEFCLALLLMLLILPLILGLGILLLFICGQVFIRVPCSSFSPSRRHGHSQRAETFDLLRFNTRTKDGRLFWLGRWLESWEGQRLPELLNVLKGDLALVGLKPMVSEGERQVREAWCLEQGHAQAGFTGQWYLETDEHSAPEESLIADAYYLAIVSTFRDWKILSRTPAAWWWKARSKGDK